MADLVAGIVSLSQATAYLAHQGWQQARLLARRTPIADVIAEGRESPERLARLRLVPVIKGFAREKLQLVPGNSYEDYIRLDGQSVTWIVQAAEKRRLQFRTWWFPIVGSQPYLGFFRKEDAREFQDKMKGEGFDTTMGGVQAFSMLGYLADPLYSSMLDGNSIPEFVDVVIHESVHATLYVPGFSSFNENLASFVALHGTAAFLREHPELEGNADEFLKSHERNQIAQRKFREFLMRARREIEAFYASAANDSVLRDDGAFLSARSALFDRLSADYATHMAGAEKGTGYAWAFSKGRINNAVILGYSLYEAHFEPFEVAFAAAGGSVPRFMTNLKRCLEKRPENEAELWKRVEFCGEEER